MQLPDFSIGYGTEVEEPMRWFAYLQWVLALALLAVYIVWKRKRKAAEKR